MNIKTEITKLHYDKNAKGLWFNLLKFVSVFYGIGSGLKNFLYDRQILKPAKVDAFVISVGNLTTGGVGKTPVTAEIVKYLIKKGEKVAIVSRGYGGKLSNKQVNVISDGEKIYYNSKLAGDEPYWLATNTKAVVVTSKNRIKAAEFAIKEFGVKYIILDDGFQHRKLHRNLDLVLIDSEKMFGNECLLPAGPLREGMEAINRLGKILVVSKNFDHSKAEKYTRIISKKMGKPAYLCKTEPDFIYNIKTGEPLADVHEIVAMSAIGQPEQFFQFLKDFDIKEKITFDDHHMYSKEDIPNTDLPIITTEKDAVKIKDFGFENLYALKLKTVFDVEGILKNE